MKIGVPLWVYRKKCIFYESGTPPEKQQSSPAITPSIPKTSYPSPFPITSPDFRISFKPNKNLTNSKRLEKQDSTCSSNSTLSGQSITDEFIAHELDEIQRRRKISDTGIARSNAVVKDKRKMTPPSIKVLPEICLEFKNLFKSDTNQNSQVQTTKSFERPNGLMRTLETPQKTEKPQKTVKSEKYEKPEKSEEPEKTEKPSKHLASAKNIIKIEVTPIEILNSQELSRDTPELFDKPVTTKKPPVSPKPRIANKPKVDEVTLSSLTTQGPTYSAVKSELNLQLRACFEVFHF